MISDFMKPLFQELLTNEALSGILINPLGRTRSLLTKDMIAVMLGAAEERTMRLDRFLADMNLGTERSSKRPSGTGEVTSGGIPERDPGRTMEAGDEETFPRRRSGFLSRL